jgi:hypothetical protein
MAIIDKKQQLRQVVIMFVFAFLIYGFWNIYLSKVLTRNKLNKTVEKLAESMNSKCPYMYDDETVLEKVFYAKEKTIVYEFRLLNYSKDDFNLRELNEGLTESLIKEIDSIESLLALRNNKIIN